MPSATGRALVNAQAVIESFSLSSNGERLAYGLRQVAGGRYVSHLWSVAWSGGRPKRLTSGSVRDVNPAISPDGRLLAFTRTAVGPDPGEAQSWEGAGWVARPHIQNWLDCIKTRRQPNADVEIGHRSISVCHLVNITRQIGRRLQWDPDRETFPGDEEANAYLDRPQRKGWELPDLA